MTGRNLLRTLLAAITLTALQVANATEFTTSATGNWSTTPSGACADAYTIANSTWDSYRASGSGTCPATGETYADDCQWRNKTTEQWQTVYAITCRADSCPEGEEFNESTQQCEPSTICTDPPGTVQRIRASYTTDYKQSTVMNNCNYTLHTSDPELQSVCFGDPPVSCDAYYITDGTGPNTPTPNEDDPVPGLAPTYDFNNEDFDTTYSPDIGTCIITAFGNEYCVSEVGATPPAPPAPDANQNNIADEPASKVTVDEGQDNTPDYVIHNYYPDSHSIPGGNPDPDGSDGNGDTNTTFEVDVDVCDPRNGDDCRGPCDPTKGDECGFNDSGDCAIQPTCDGAPITCAVAKYTWNLNCAFEQPTETDVDAVIDEGFGGDMTVPTEEIDVSSYMPTIQTSSAQCLDDLPISTPWAELVIPTSELCFIFQIGGLFVLMGVGVFAVRTFSDL